MVQEPQEEKKEFLKREEIRTMAKDIARLREIESQEEREKISSLGIEGKIKTAITEQKEPKEEKSEEVKKEISIGLMPKSPLPKISLRKKYLIRGGFVLVAVLVLGLFLWYLATKGSSQEELPPPEELPTQQNPPVNATPTNATSTNATPTQPIINATTTPDIIDRLVSWGYYLPKATRTIDTIIIHSTFNDTDSDVYNVEKIIQRSKISKVSPHYLIDREGKIYHLVEDLAVAYHAGVSQMLDGSRKNIINIFSIGIQLVYKEDESPNDVQYEVLASLVNYLKDKYNISSSNILGQNQIAPGRKTDPWNFDWIKFNQIIEKYDQ